MLLSLTLISLLAAVPDAGPTPDCPVPAFNPAALQDASADDIERFREAWQAREQKCEQEQAAARRAAGSATPDCPVPEYRPTQSTDPNEIERQYQRWLDREQKCDGEQAAARRQELNERIARDQAEQAAIQKQIDDTNAKMKAQQEAQAAEEAKRVAPLIAELNGVDGFQAAKWGMSMAKVRALFPGTRRQESKLQIHRNVAGFPATVTFFFAQNKLKTVLVAFGHTNKVGSNDELFMTLGKALASKYGPPSDLHAALGTAGEWSGAKTTIALRDSAASANLGSAAEIQYDSVELHDLIQDVGAKAKSDL